MRTQQPEWLLRCITGAQVKFTTLWMTSRCPLPPSFGIWLRRLALHNREPFPRGSYDYLPRMRQRLGLAQRCAFPMPKPNGNFNGSHVTPIIELESRRLFAGTKRYDGTTPAGTATTAAWLANPASATKGPIALLVTGSNVRTHSCKHCPLLPRWMVNDG